MNHHRKIIFPFFKIFNFKMARLKEEIIILLFIFLIFPLNSASISAHNNSQHQQNIVDENGEKHLRIFATTFNVNGVFPHDKNDLYLEEWLKIDKECPPDLIIIGLQEMTPVDNWRTYIDDNNYGRKREELWKENLGEYLKKLELGYELKSSHRSNGVFLAIFDKKLPISEHEKNSKELAIKEHRQHSKELTIKEHHQHSKELTIKEHHQHSKELTIHKNSIKTGFKIFFYVFGNKGGVGISFELEGVKFCFVSSHLAAGNKLEKRNEDFAEIAKMKFDNEMELMDHDLVFWLGDLNYRLDIKEELPTIGQGHTKEELKTFSEKKEKLLSKFREQIRNNNIENLLQQKDQLIIIKRMKNEKNEILKEFKEAKITFKPTYKYEPNKEEEWNTKKPEFPAWCDRILYRIKPDKKNIKIVQKETKYYSSTKPMFSDHKPVIGEFLVKITKDKSIK